MAILNLKLMKPHVLHKSKTATDIKNPRRNLSSIAKMTYNEALKSKPSAHTVLLH